MASLMHMAAPPRKGKAPAAGLVREPVSYALGTRAKVACLRILSMTGGHLTQRELARRAGLQHRTSQLALAELAALGLVRRIEGGRDVLVNLNAEHHLAPSIVALFTAESGFFIGLRAELAAAVNAAPRNARPVSVVLFGSVARGDDQPGSDVDVLVLTADERAIDLALSALTGAGDRLRARYGHALRPIAYGLADARRRWRRRQAPLPEIMRDHIVLLGSPLRETLGA